VLTRKRTIISTAFFLLLLILLILFFVSPYSTALFRSKTYFIQHSSTPNVYYEPGAEDYADSIGSYLPKAVARVEQVHGLPFMEPFNIYVCSTQKSFNEFTAITTSPYPIRGTALLGDVFIAPSAFHFIGIDTHKETLKHELSHLHFRQRLGFFKGRKHPIWFSEGFADYVAGSGGEGIDDSEAVDFLLSGRHFVPEEEGGIFSTQHKAFNGLSGPMFHKQAKMFVTYLFESDSSKCQAFLREIQEGESFGRSFSNTMGSKIQDRWIQFLSQLNAKERVLPGT